MDNVFPQKDTDLLFPQFTVLKASAGSGKTYALSQRFVQFILSRHVPQNHLRNILAMTFSNNAAKEMRSRILGWLKKIALGEDAAISEFEALLDLSQDELRARASSIIEEIIEHYSDFQVKTIDSFTTALFQASSVDFGYPPEFEIILDNTNMTEYAFQRYLRRVSEGSLEAELIDRMVLSIISQKQGEASYIWDPGSALLEEIRNIVNICASRGKDLAGGRESEALERCKREISREMDTLAEAIHRSGLDLSKASAYFKSDMPGLVRQGRIGDLIGKRLAAPPVNKPKKLTTENLAAHKEVLAIWERVRDIICRATLHYAYAFYEPYASVFLAFNGLLEETKRRQGKVFIGDINRHLAEHLSKMSVPDIYFRVGETIHHFLIDEFQDTSPVQWKTLLPLLENTVAERGSIFLVGDTKQAIYGFRDADYRIMAGTSRQNPFPSASYVVQDLKVNYRSGSAILGLNEEIFHHRITVQESYIEAADASGLNNYQQQPKPGRKRVGNVTVSIVERADEGIPERESLLGTMNELRQRKYNYGDMAILTQRNEDAVRVTGWLNENGIDFISFSSLDIRRRGLTAEIIALLRFLDAPTDSLSFAAFLLGDIFARACKKQGIPVTQSELHDLLIRNRSEKALYKAFAAQYPEIWELLFNALMKEVGYLPIYDLVSQIYYIFDLFSIYAEEEATLMRLLETVKDFEGLGYNSLSEFLKFADTEEGAAAEWQMTVPAAQDAVRVMTVHKAKGLDFPATIVLLYEQQQRGIGAVTDENDEEMQLLRITKEMAECNDTLGEKYDESQLKDRVNSLNMLYVGLTRAREELHVIGITGKPENPGYPINLFTGLQRQYGESLQCEAMEGAVSPGRFLLHGSLKKFEFAVSGGSLRLRERRRGELLHAVLAAIEFIDTDVAQQIEQILGHMRKTGIIAAQEEIDMNALLSFLSLDAIRQLFFPDDQRQIHNEYEIVAKDGRLYRIDRLVIDPDCVTIVDFKTGSDEEYAELHEKQVGTYARLIKECFPGKTIECVLAYIDRGEIRRIA